MHRLAHRVRPALRALRAVHTGSHESPASAAASGSRIPLWGVAAVFAGGAAVGYMASGEKKSLKVSAEITRELKAPKPLPEPQNASAVEPTSLVASSVDAPSADASVTTDNALTESHPDEKQASVEDEGGDDTALEGEVPKVAAPYDPETGEFNWDCPCLGGLPDTICGEQFKESFRCFVKSEAEPKGMDCIDAFNAMQQCFREHPEVYAREIEIYDEVDKEGGSPGADTETQLQDSITSRVDSAPAQQAGGITPPVEHPREISKPVREKPAPTSTRRTA